MRKIMVTTFTHGVDGTMLETTSEHDSAKEALAYTAGFNKAAQLFLTTGLRRSAIIPSINTHNWKDK